MGRLFINISPLLYSNRSFFVNQRLTKSSFTVYYRFKIKQKEDARWVQCSFLFPIPWGQEEAVRRIQQLLPKLKEQYAEYISGASELWNGNSAEFQFTAQGYDITGSISVTPTTIDVSGKLPFLVSFFKGKIEGMIREKAGELLAPV